MPNARSDKYFCFQYWIRSGPPGVETVNRALTLMLAASGVIPGINAELFHSSEESSAVNAHARGSSIGAAHAPLRYSERAYDRVPLLLRIPICHSSVIV